MGLINFSGNFDKVAKYSKFGLNKADQADLVSPIIHKKSNDTDFASQATTITKPNSNTTFHTENINRNFSNNIIVHSIPELKINYTKNAEFITPNTNYAWNFNPKHESINIDYKSTVSSLINSTTPQLNKLNTVLLSDRATNISDLSIIKESSVLNFSTPTLAVPNSEVNYIATEIKKTFKFIEFKYPEINTGVSNNLAISKLNTTFNPIALSELVKYTTEIINKPSIDVNFSGVDISINKYNLNTSQITSNVVLNKLSDNINFISHVSLEVSKTSDNINIPTINVVEYSNDVTNTNYPTKSHNFDKVDLQTSRLQSNIQILKLSLDSIFTTSTVEIIKSNLDSKHTVSNVAIKQNFSENLVDYTINNKILELNNIDTIHIIGTNPILSNLETKHNTSNVDPKLSVTDNNLQSNIIVNRYTFEDTLESNIIIKLLSTDSLHEKTDIILNTNLSTDIHNLGAVLSNILSTDIHTKSDVTVELIDNINSIHKNTVLLDSISVPVDFPTVTINMLSELSGRHVLGSIINYSDLTSKHTSSNILIQPYDFISQLFSNITPVITNPSGRHLVGNSQNYMNLDTKHIHGAIVEITNPEGRHTQGRRPDDTILDGRHTEGQRPDDTTPSGRHNNGIRPDDSILDGRHTQGRRPDDTILDGRHTNGQRPDDTILDGRHTQGRRPGDTDPDGRHTDGKKPDDTNPAGRHTNGQRPDDTNPAGRHNSGRRPGDTDPEGRHTQGRRPDDSPLTSDKFPANLNLVDYFINKNATGFDKDFIYPDPSKYIIGSASDGTDKLDDPGNPEGRHTDGKKPDDTNPEGRHTEGQRPDDTTPDGRHTDGKKPDDTNPEGRHTTGRKPDDTNPEGRHTEGQKPEDTTPDGRHTDGKKPDDTNPEGRHTEGQRPDDTTPDGRHTEGGNISTTKFFEDGFTKDVSSTEYKVGDVDQLINSYKPLWQRGDGTYALILRGLQSGTMPQTYNTVGLYFERKAEDVLRFTKNIPTVRGAKFLLWNTQLQKMNPGSWQGGTAVQKFNIANMTLLHGAPFFGKRHGGSIFGKDGYYSEVVKPNQSVDENRLVKISKQLFNTDLLRGTRDNPVERINEMSKSGGPNSKYGVGETVIKTVMSTRTSRLWEKSKTAPGNIDDMSPQNNKAAKYNDVQTYKSGMDSVHIENANAILNYGTNDSEKKRSLSREVNKQQAYKDAGGVLGADIFTEADFYSTNIQKAISPDGKSYDFIKLWLSDLPGENVLVFRALLTSLSDDISADWDASFDTIGRYDPLYKFTGTTAGLSISFNLFAFTIADLKLIYKKLNYLKSMCAPSFASKNSNKAIAPFIKITVGDIYNQVPCKIDSISVDYNLDGGGWETSEGMQATKMLEITLSLTQLFISRPEFKNSEYPNNVSKLVQGAIIS